MAKFMQILLVAFLAVALVAGEPRRFQGRRNRFLARQELEEPVTPYPSADELKPEVPFDEAVASEGQTPFNPVAGEGESSFTPVGADGESSFVPVGADGESPFTPVAGEDESSFTPVGADGESSFTPVAAEGETPFTPDEVYGPPEDTPASARLTARRAAVRRVTARPAKLRKPVRAQPAKLRKAVPARLQAQPQYVPQPLFYYIAH